MIEINDIRDDLAAFADDEADIVIEPNGRVLFTRGGKDVECSIAVSDRGTTLVAIDGQEVPYREFLTRQLAQLDVFASRLLEKRQDVPAFIDGPAALDSVPEGHKQGSALDLLTEECAQSSPFASRVVFITADAGNGKTALLRHVQAREAARFVEGKAGAVFWHVDLQGRQLLRLSEALMGDVTDLRVPGLWMPAVIRLIRHRALILAIDGFDELSAEQGTTNALGALALLVHQLEGRGVIVAASRRAFFDSDAYLQRSRLFRQVATDACEFDQLALLPWDRTEAVSYLSYVQDDGRTIANPEQTYDKLVSLLHGDATHVMVTRPFLLSHIARGLLRYDLEPAEFIQPVGDQLSGVASVVRAFIDREVSDKWRFRDTGEPFLSVDQHMTFLASVAEEMYLAQTDRLSLEVVETIAITLMDDWNIDVPRRQQIMGMVRMHVLLPQPESDPHDRNFDHPEFREYFLAIAMIGMLQRVAEGGDTAQLSRFLSVAQLSDSTAGYVAGLLNFSASQAARAVEGLAGAARRERRPTFVQVNCGTLIPYLLNGHRFDRQVVVDAPVVFSSVVFENMRLFNLRFSGSTFLNVSFLGSTLERVSFQDCDLGEPAFELDDEHRYVDVEFQSCRIGGLRLMHDGDEDREYAPSRVGLWLGRLGIALVEPPGDAAQDRPAPSETSPIYKAANHFLKCFQRSTVVNERILNHRYHAEAATIRDVIIPIMEQCGVLARRQWAGRGKAQGVWLLQYRLEDVLAAEDGSQIPELSRFWDELKSAMTAEARDR